MRNLSQRSKIGLIALLVVTLVLVGLSLQTFQGLLDAKVLSTSSSIPPLTTVSNAVFAMGFGDGVTKSAPGELVTYTVKVTNKDVEGRSLHPQVSVETKGLEIPTVSNRGKRGHADNGKPGGTVEWNAINDKNTVEVFNKKSHLFTFQVKTPSTIGSEYCVHVETFGLPLLQQDDCNQVVKISPQKNAFAKVPTPKPSPTPKLTKANFSITGPDSLSTDRADQEISWQISPAVQKAYPAVKIELCPGKPFKDCINLEAEVDNDGSQIINMPPVPRVGKWYLHIIGRNANGEILPQISLDRLVLLHT